MPSRYPTHIKFDYCLNPLHLFDGEKDVVVPCGRCDGCRVHAANIWSQRLGQEISSCPDSLFVTPTYNNKFLPKLVEVGKDSGVPLWISDHRDNWRFAVSRCSLREDAITIKGSYDAVPVTNFDSYPCIPYASKRDITLWLKLIRKQLSQILPQYEKRGYFRYFIVSEYGETKFRPHYHCIFFPFFKEVSDLFIAGLLYENWQMCDKDRFQEHIEPCNSGTSNYLTTYVNSITNIPKVYKNNEIRPFRLASKSPAIGYGSYIREEVYEKIIEGTFEYVRPIERLESRYLVRYAKNYISSLFPKCVGYGQKSFDELLYTYGILYRSVYSLSAGKEYFVSGKRIISYADGLSFSMRPSDYNASRKCKQVCDEIGCTPFHYCHLLDMAWYLNDMYALHMFYSFHEKEGTSSLMMSLYVNLGDWLEKFQTGNITQRQIMMLDFFFEGFCIDSLDICNYRPQDFLCSSRPDSDYVAELEDILNNMVKMPKFNEKLGISPVNQFT